MTIERRATGWLDPLHHARVREFVLHAIVRYRLLCPAYCLMPDHAHFLWIGWSDTSDQKQAAKLLRESWNDLLGQRGWCLQKQAHDHVLRQQECERSSFSTIAAYILENPVRAGLVADWRDYCAVIPGYPSLDPRRTDFWEIFWRIDASLMAAGIGERLTPSATH